MTSSLVSELTPFCEEVVKFRAGSSTPRDYLETCLEAIARSEDVIKAFTHYDLEKARAQADAATRRYRDGQPLSPIDGMPIGVKDIIDTADFPTEMNSPIYTGHRPALDAPSVQAAREGGAVIVGKTVTTEFAIGRSGPTVNPHATTHTPGGSSSGSAAGVAAGMMPAAFGTQTNGSIVRPAGYCGVVGYKPSIGMLSTEGLHSLSRTNDHLGTIARSVADAWSLARWVSEQAPQKSAGGLSGPLDGNDLGAVRPQRVAVLRTGGFDELDDASREAFEHQLKTLRDAGVVLVDPDPSGLLAGLLRDLDAVPDRSVETVAYEMRWPYGQYLEKYPEKLGPRIPKLVAQGRAISRDRYRALLSFRADLQARVAALSDAFDAFVLPSSSGPAPEGLEYTGSRTLLTYGSFLGLPAFSLPVMQVGGMPFGLQILGFHGADARLARHARWILASRASS